MKAQESNFLDLIKKASQFEIPIYQRTYSWEREECKQLWDDIIRCGTDERISAHFVGSVVYITKGIYQISDGKLLVIDGQQRLTTVLLILEALARQLGESEPIEGFCALKLRNYYLKSLVESGDKAYKLLLTQTDRQTLKSILDGVQVSQLSGEVSHRVKENFMFFEECIQGMQGQLVPVYLGLAKLCIVDVALDRSHDNAQLIFESMNSTGRELSQADLIRNFVLMGLENELQTKLYEGYWRKMELAFGQEGYQKEFDGFMRHYLTFRTGDIPNIDKVYDAFKRYSRLPEEAAKGIEALLADVHRFAVYYCAMALDKESDGALASIFKDLKDYKVDVAFPLLLELYDDFVNGKLGKDDFVAVLRLVESYVFRRGVCAIPTNTLNRVFAGFARSIKKDDYLNSVKAIFLTMPAYKRFPDDDEFVRELKTRDLYNFPRRNYWLRRIENFGRKERVAVEEYTIEHILPQNDNLSREWRDALGPDWKQVQSTYLHTLGNLTLTGYNTEYSDKPFPVKRDMDGGFKASPLRLNEGLGVVDTWNGAAIESRAERLARLACEVWAVPSLPEEILMKYKPEDSDSESGFSIEDHQHLSNDSPMRPLFEKFRREVKAIDPRVSEVFLKTYVAYKAETNFVDVDPQRKRLKLFINMPFPDIDDPRGLAKDYSNIGRQGNGDVCFELSDEADLPYVMKWIRQAFELQVGSGDSLF